MFVIRFTLEISDSITTKYVNNAVTDLSLSAIADELIHSPPMPDDVFQGMNELLVRFHAVEITHEAFRTDEELGRLCTIVDGWGIRVHGIRGDWFMTAMHIQCGESRFEVLAEGPIVGTSGPTCRRVERLLDYVDGRSYELRT